MKGFADWIRHHQVAAFYLLTFAITWGLGFSYDAVLQRGQVLLAPVAFAATCGPALAGIIISAVSNTSARCGSRWRVWIAFLVAWVVSACIFLSNMVAIQHATLSPMLIALGLCVAVLPAFVISMAYSRVPAIKDYLSSLARLRGVWGWSLIALILPPALVFLALVTSELLGTQPAGNDRLPVMGLQLLGLIVVKFVYQLFYFNATGEEAGWRGFAMPRLQVHTSPLITALILALFWVPWHLFLWRAEGLPVSSLLFWVEKYLTIIPLSLIIVWLCNRAKGNILVAGIAHAAANTADAFVPYINFWVVVTVMAVTAMTLVIIDRMWKRLPAGHPAVHTSSQQAAQLGVVSTSTFALLQVDGSQQTCSAP